MTTVQLTVQFDDESVYRLERVFFFNIQAEGESINNTSVLDAAFFLAPKTKTGWRLSSAEIAHIIQALNIPMIGTLDDKISHLLYDLPFWKTYNRNVCISRSALRT